MKYLTLLDLLFSDQLLIAVVQDIYYLYSFISFFYLSLFQVQFLAIEIARNREGLNEGIRGKFKPKARKARVEATAGAAVTEGSGGMTEIEHELQQILGGQHQLMQ